MRDLLERIAALACVERVIPGRLSHVGGSGRLRLTDSGMPAGQSGRKLTILTEGRSLELFLVPCDGQMAMLEAALAALPEYAAQGNLRRQAEAATASARASRIAAARLHHGPTRPATSPRAELPPASDQRAAPPGPANRQSRRRSPRSQPANGTADSKPPRGARLDH